jgi:5-oxopent-3-ene-1,2,5-tricarboxylate decarboxylase / 2-hydroxyhepta-2,4-diene-1,7-dioate isomerase
MWHEKNTNILVIMNASAQANNLPQSPITLSGAPVLPGHELFLLPGLAAPSCAHYLAVLNHTSWFDSLGNALSQPPYKAPPKAPVLCVKPDTAVVRCDAQGLACGPAAACWLMPTLVFKITAPAFALSPEHALACVGAVALGCDVSTQDPLENEAWYRPGLARRAADGFALLGNWQATSASAITQGWDVLVNGSLLFNTALMLRPAARLIADLSQFMNLRPGDTVWLGGTAQTYCWQPGQRLAIAAAGLPDLFVQGA